MANESTKTTKLFSELTTQDSKKYRKKDSYEVAITNYADALSSISIVLMNNAPGLDENLVMELYEVESREFYENGNPDCGCEDLEDCQCQYEMPEIYQWLVTDASEYTLNKLKERHGIVSVWSDTLGVHVIPVYHYGTSWSYISVPDNDFNADDILELI